MDDSEKLATSVLEKAKGSIIKSGIVDDGEINYLSNQSDRYRFLIKAAHNHFHGNMKFLDVGSHLLHFAIAAKFIGYDVFGTDVQYHLQIPQNLKREKRHNITNKLCDLSKHSIPFEDEYFDLVNFSETLEHLPFNPIPTLKEIFRVLKPKGALFITTPNATRIGNRIRLLFGRNIYTSIAEYCNKVPYGIHYREYTLPEVVNLVKLAGFEISYKSVLYFDKGSSWRKYIKSIVMVTNSNLAGNIFIKAIKK